MKVSRTIKFRGQQKDGRWVFGYYAPYHVPVQDEHCNPKGLMEVPAIYNDEPGERNNGGYFKDIIPETLGEYTGIKDSMGRDIYEGDIVNIEGMSEKGDLVVVFNEGSFALATSQEYKSVLLNMHPFLNDYARLTELGIFDYQGLYKIIGNVHDNPELLTL